jgi:DNA mismatch repair protein MutH
LRTSLLRIFIVAKIRRGEAHLLSEGDTYYLGACTKAKNSSVVRDQPMSRLPAKPRAFSLKQTYLNFIIQRDLLGRDVTSDSIYKGEKEVKTIEQEVADKFDKYLGKSDKQILEMLEWNPEVKSKNYKRLLANRILTGTGSNKVEELEKANVTLRTVTLEHTGTLTESI